MHREELVNSITHGIGSVLSVAGLVLLVVFASLDGNAWHIVSFSVFGGSMVVLYASSTLYHSVREERTRRFFRKLDHMSIFLLIAGTYTPYCLVVLNNWLGWTIFGIVWGCCVFGIVFKALFTGRWEIFSIILYLVMGWMIIVAIRPLYLSLPAPAFILLVAGGLSYSAGTLFYVRERMRYSHGVWHVFVLGGSVCHFFSVISLL